MVIKMKKWLKINVKADAVLAEVISDYLVGIHSAGVDLAADNDENPEGKIVAFIEQEDLRVEDAEIISQQISTFLAEMAAVFVVELPELSWEFIEEEDWSKNWKEHFVPFPIVPGLIIAPTWADYVATEGESVIVMDPGMAFGTGHHETTSLSLAYVQQVVGEGGGKSVLDVGTGTGILLMGARLFGAESGLGIDMCPDAVAAAADNIKHNGMASALDIAITPLAELTDQYELVVANIIHDVLVSMSADLFARVAAGGSLVLSGLLAGEQVDSIIEKFTAAGFVLREHTARGEWAAVLFNKEV